jgi:hypothetical protein
VFDWREQLHPDDQPRIVQQSVAGETSLKPSCWSAIGARTALAVAALRSAALGSTGNHIGFIGVATASPQPNRPSVCAG